MVGNLKEYAILYKDLHTVEGEPVCRMLSEGSILKQDDLHTPPQELNLAKGQKLLWIPVDTRTFVPSLVVPGDMVSFLVWRPPVPAHGPCRSPIATPKAAAPPLPAIPSIRRRKPLRRRLDRPAGSGRFA